jgi:hypothetical protein
MKKSSQSRTPSQLSKSLDTKLKHYALAASAAGASLLAISQSGEAKVIYTPVNKTIPYNSTPIPIDLNRDGIDDFSLNAISSTGERFSQAFVQVTPSNSVNRVWGLLQKVSLHSGSILAAGALPPGVEVGRTGRFANSGAQVLADRSIVVGTLTSATKNYIGNWANYGKGVTDRFLAFSIKINNETHYGWARMNVVWGIKPTATLTGYAYETIANKPIATGLPRSTDVPSTEPEPATLGHLARGAAAIPAWRRTATPDH